jgi:hypothetical protein
MFVGLCLCQLTLFIQDKVLYWNKPTQLHCNPQTKQRYTILISNFHLFWMSYAFFWVIPRRLNFTCRRFGTLRLYHLHRKSGMRITGIENVGVFISEYTQKLNTDWPCNSKVPHIDTSKTLPSHLSHVPSPLQLSKFLSADSLTWLALWSLPKLWRSVYCRKAS